MVAAPVGGIAEVRLVLGNPFGLRRESLLEGKLLVLFLWASW